MNVRIVTLLFLLMSPVLLAFAAGQPANGYLMPLTIPTADHRNRVLVPQLGSSIFIEKGDTGVTPGDVQNVIHVLEAYSLPTLQTVFSKTATSVPLYVRLYSTENEFTNAIHKYFPAAATTQPSLLDGFTNGTTAFIPMYDYKSSTTGFPRYDDADLSDYLTHELTHVLINAYNITIPTWVNEGFATYEGMAGQTAYNADFASRMSNSGYYGLNLAAAKGELSPLSLGERAILDDPNLNVEFEDYAAVSELIADYGLGVFTHFLFLSSKMSAAAAYQQTYHSTIGQYESFFYDYNNQSHARSR